MDDTNMDPMATPSDAGDATPATDAPAPAAEETTEATA